MSNVSVYLTPSELNIYSFFYHSAENVQGYLSRDILKTFSVSGPDESHVLLAGQEQIPRNWYKRPSGNPYGAGPAFVSSVYLPTSSLCNIILTTFQAEVAILATKYPEIVQFGGNSDKVNSFVGVDPGDLTGGVFNAANLLQGNNLGYFFFIAAQEFIPAGLKGVVSDLTPALAVLNKNLSPVLTQLDCPALITFDQSALNQFPGASYHPTA
jgi:hypothetical protein